MSYEGIVRATSILIIRLSAIGDIVMASPLIAALRRKYPDARLVWLVQPEGYDLLAANEQLDAVMIWPRNEWRELWRQRRVLTLIKRVVSFVRQLRRQRFDLALDVQGLLKSGIWAWLSGARQRIGLGSGEGSAWLMTRVVKHHDGDDRIGAEYRSFARALELPDDDFVMHVALSADDRDFARHLLQERGLEGGYIVICPFTTRPQKHWFESRWLDLIGQINTQLSLPVIILGGPGDASAAQRLVREQDDSINLAGRTSLCQAAAVIARARLLIGVDTGLTHMGIALAVPTITLFGSTCPYRDSGRDDTIVLYSARDCSPCWRNPTCHGDFTCMRDLGVGDVMQAATRLLTNQAAVTATADDHSV